MIFKLPHNAGVSGRWQTNHSAITLVDMQGGGPVAGKFELFKDKGGEFRWHLKAANGEIVASSRGYKTRASAVKGIESVRATAGMAVLVPQATLVEDEAVASRMRARRPASSGHAPRLKAVPSQSSAKRHLHAAGVFDSGRSDISERMEEILAAEVEQ